MFLLADWRCREHSAKAGNYLKVSATRQSWGQKLTGDFYPLFLWAWRSQLTFILPKYMAVCHSQFSNWVRGAVANVKVERLNWKTMKGKFVAAAFLAT